MTPVAATMLRPSAGTLSAVLRPASLRTRAVPRAAVVAVRFVLARRGVGQVGRQRPHRNRLPQQPFDLPQIVALFPIAEREGDAAETGAARAADAVHVRFRLVR